jgi:TIGR00730 family protein
MKSIAVYCGSGAGASPAYREGAVRLGHALAERRIALVYGGANVGLMGAVADAVLERGGRVIGVLPHFLQEREIAHSGLSELILVETMHERKAKMAELADGFIALPGGPGTMEEYFEVFAWGQLGLHRKPCGLLNIRRYFDPLLAMFDRMVSEGFMKPEYRAVVLTDETPDGLLDRFAAYAPPAIKTYRPGQRFI